MVCDHSVRLKLINHQQQATDVTNINVRNVTEICLCKIMQCEFCCNQFFLSRLVHSHLSYFPSPPLLIPLSVQYHSLILFHCCITTPIRYWLGCNLVVATACFDLLNLHYTVWRGLFFSSHKLTWTFLAFKSFEIMVLADLMDLLTLIWMYCKTVIFVFICTFINMQNVFVVRKTAVSENRFAPIL